MPRRYNREKLAKGNEKKECHQSCCDPPCGLEGKVSVESRLFSRAVSQELRADGDDDAKDEYHGNLHE